MRKLLGLFLLLFSFSPGAYGSDETVNFRFSPIGLIVGPMNAYVDFAVAPQWTLGPTFSYWRFSLSSSDAFSEDYRVTAWDAGVRANWFKNGNFTDGLYLGPSLTYAHVRVSTLDNAGQSVRGKIAGLFFTGLAGYGWFWECFNLMLGGGFTLGLNESKVRIQDSMGDSTDVTTPITGFTLEFSLGWAF